MELTGPVSRAQGVDRASRTGVVARDARGAPRPHDLLWIEGVPLMTDGDPMPAWASPDWLAVAPVVVRREATPAGWVPIGLRGRARHQRAAARVRPGAMVRLVAPEDLVHDVGTRYEIAASWPAVLQRFRQLIVPLDALGLSWGPTGSAGFVLASGIDVLGPQSDLDLLVRAPRPLEPAQCRVLSRLLDSPGRRIDLQVETPAGAFSYLDWRRAAARVMLKTPSGPILVRDPWNPAIP